MTVTSAAEELAATQRAPWPAARRNLWLLVGVAIAFGLIQLVVIGLGAEYSTDEAIYLSQLNPLVPDYGWDAWRAWGAPVLAGPVALTDAPLAVVRLYLVILSSAGLFLAYRPWLAVTRKPLAPIAAGVFATTAVVIYNGSLDLPNLYSALAAIGAAGFFVAARRGAETSRGPIIGLTLAIALAALVRPSDSLWLALPLGLIWLGARAWRRLAVIGAIVAGQILGWAPWVIESIFRFGGPMERLKLSSAMLGGTHLYPDAEMIKIYLRLWGTGNMGAVSLDVPRQLRGGSQTAEAANLGHVGLVGAVGLTAAAVVIAIGIASALRSRKTSDDVCAPVLIALAVGGSVAFPYLFMMRYGQLRFVLPAVGLLMVPLAAGVLRIAAVRPVRLRILGPVLAVTLVAGLAGVQLVEARRVRSGIDGANRTYSALIARLDDLGFGDRSCTIAGETSFTIAYQVGCDALGRVNNPGPVEPAFITAARGTGDQVAIVIRAVPAPGTFLDQWRLDTVTVAGRSWYIYLPPA